MSAVADTRMQHAMLAAHEYLQRVLRISAREYAGTVQQFDALHYVVAVISPPRTDGRHVHRAVQVHRDASTTRMRAEVDALVKLTLHETKTQQRPEVALDVTQSVVEHVRETLHLMGHSASVVASPIEQGLDVLALVSHSRVVRIVLSAGELSTPHWREIITARLRDRESL